MTTPPRGNPDPGLIRLSSEPPGDHEKEEVVPAKAPTSPLPEEVEELLRGPPDDHDIWNQE